MPTPSVTTLRRCAAIVVTLPMLLSTGSAHAADQVPLKVHPTTVTEGDAARPTIRIDCPQARCSASVRTVNASAIAGDDYVARDRRAKVPKKAGVQFFRISATGTIEDATCERKEFFTVIVTAEYPSTGKRDTDQASVTIEDDDCSKPGDPANPGDPGDPGDPGGDPDPAPAPTPAPDTGSPTYTNYGLVDGAAQVCRTPAWSGTMVSSGYYNSGCTVTVQCPSYVRLCSLSTTSSISLENMDYGHTVTLNSRYRVYAAGAPVDPAYERVHHDVSCAGTGSCSVSDGTMIYGGETATSQCNGVRQSSVQPNRSTVTCQLTVQKRQ